ncbi:protein-L-isoaspartate(D-aspartate) O-methyltransferase [Allosphingosinicella flava]|uniref:Protein-L-isoaspartate O-methyltransferase n=1 Tax=Allosphingosinicella flava TaxID=2771430 RepID=A0A7T2GJT4_9SPHN|nr:protein-L-isoaspartate(D-aspartate) O-methyltransferase [Sphingosinicella flava]QPQ55182.1 protein-L-isoaspartate(D-aspartate) O-methyltransferase [Sphingosinicella flava]
MPDLAQAREKMVERQIAARGIHDAPLLDAMRAVPREEFIPHHLIEFAYEDSPLPIEADQTISQPYIVALMIEAAGVAPGDKVLEIGAGSGYAAAIMGKVADHVVSIERHHELAALAAERMRRLGYANVRIVEGDGTEGCPAEAPFDAIIAAASGPSVPDILKAQLKIGGRLVMPLGEPHSVQTLVKVTRRGEDDYDMENLGGVRFVPLIGAYGWQDHRAETAPKTLPQMIADAAEPLPNFDHPDFSALFDRYADAKVILLGEASHGTSEFYKARAAISRRLIERHGFNIVAVEADWPDAATIDRYVRRRPARRGEERAFQRFPTWMWRNTDVDDFIRWLRTHNDGRVPEDKVSFRGLDLYNMNGSIRAVIGYLEDVDPEAAQLARERYNCLMPYSRNPAAYGAMAITEGYARCEDEVVRMLKELQQSRAEYVGIDDGDEFLDAAANARLVKNAEAYYRVMYRGAAESWNLRDTHMFETLCQLLDAKGPDAKAIVWAHNSHIGNAAATEMGVVREELNIGQLCREKFGKQAVLLGFGTHSGTVAAADDWDAPMKVKTVRPALGGSYEDMSHKAGLSRFLLDLRGLGAELKAALDEPRLQRFIGVIYRPETERWSHYSEAVMPRQFDGWVWFDETNAVKPLPGEQKPGEDETYPFGL